jgi:hypothetical protein
MPRVRYSGSPLARWLDLQKAHHVTATHLVHWRADCFLAISYDIRPIVACAYRGEFIEPLPSNALSKSVTIFANTPTSSQTLAAGARLVVVVRIMY